ncbi:hypothetical protein G6F22_020041 [Rhizopus arrhizus]|nr:hypothetical protein G6F22_020041 [Rhizopus arrhizus]
MDAVCTDDNVRVQRAEVLDTLFVPDINTQAPGATAQDLQQLDARDGAATAGALDRDRCIAGHNHLPVAKAHRRHQRVEHLRLGVSQVGKPGIGHDHAEAEGGVRGILLVHRNAGLGLRLLQQDREEQA